MRLSVAAPRAKLFNYRAASRHLAGARLASTSPAAREINTRAQVYLAAGLIVGMGLGFMFTENILAGPQSKVGPRWLVTEQAPRTRRHYADTRTMLVAVDEIRTLLGEDAVSVDASDIEEHSFSEWSTSNSDIRPVAVVRPQSTDD
ncbi:hypothetical protein E4U33_007476, partial [Claviceps sp. LM78 group G4]